MSTVVEGRDAIVTCRIFGYIGSVSRVVSATAVQELAEQIMAAAERDGAVTGGRLPTERQLAVQLGVSRTSVRHALARLEAAGTLTREVGRGTFLRDRGGPGPVIVWPPAALTDVGPTDVMAVRALIEPQAMALVVAHATQRDFEQLDRCLAAGEAAQSYQDFEVWDLALHRSLIGAAHNRLLVELYASVEAARLGELFGQLKRRNDSAERREQYCRQHRRVVEAARARDGDGAVEAMRAHLACVSTNLLGAVV
jgi:GntR family transcriptional regulator, uxu operon transcriptional repressor